MTFLAEEKYHEAEIQVRRSWHNNVDTRNVLIFSLLFPEQEPFILEHISVSGGITVRQVLWNIYDIDFNNRILEFDSAKGEPKFKLINPYDTLIKALISETYGSEEQFSERLKNLLNFPKDQLNPNLLGMIRDFFDSSFMPKVAFKKLKEDSVFKTEIYQAIYTATQAQDSWRAIIVFASYDSILTNGAFLETHLTAESGMLQMLGARDFRIIIAPYFSSSLLGALAVNPRIERRGYCITPITSLEIQRKRLITGSLQEEQVKNLPLLLEGLQPGIFSLRSWPRVLGN